MDRSRFSNISAVKKVQIWLDLKHEIGFGVSIIIYSIYISWDFLVGSGGKSQRSLNVQLIFAFGNPAPARRRKQTEEKHDSTVKTEYLFNLKHLKYYMSTRSWRSLILTDWTIKIIRKSSLKLVGSRCNEVDEVGENEDNEDWARPGYQFDPSPRWFPRQKESSPGMRSEFPGHEEQLWEPSSRLQVRHSRHPMLRRGLQSRLRHRSRLHGLLRQLNLWGKLRRSLLNECTYVFDHSKVLKMMYHTYWFTNK